MAVNPASRSAYLAVSRGRGPDPYRFWFASKAMDSRSRGAGQSEILPGRTSDARGRRCWARATGRAIRGRNRSRTLRFFEDRVLVAGLSNEEFSSTFSRHFLSRSRQWPTARAWRFITARMDDLKHGRPCAPSCRSRWATSRVCWRRTRARPWCKLPMSDLKPGAKVKGKTVAELGNRNRPLDMIVYQKDGKDYLLLPTAAAA